MRKYLIAALPVFIIAVALISCTIGVDTDFTALERKDCDALQVERADGRSLQEEIDNSGKSFLTLAEEEAQNSFMGRLFMRILIWRSGNREAANAEVARLQLQHMKALDREIAARCN